MTRQDIQSKTRGFGTQKEPKNPANKENGAQKAGETKLSRAEILAKAREKAAENRAKRKK